MTQAEYLEAARVATGELVGGGTGVTSVNGRTGSVSITKIDVGLPDVDNVSAAALRARASHTGVQAISTVTGLQAALDSKEPLIAASTTDKYWRGDKSFQTLDKAAVGLANVDNTSDANKPVSTAQQAALDLKENTQTAVSQAEAEAGTEVAIRKWSPLRVAQAIAALGGGAASFSGARVVRSTAQSVDHNTDTKISWSSATHDTDSYFAAGDPTKLTITTSGVYLITLVSSFIANSTGVRYFSVKKNNTTSLLAQYIVALNGSPTVQTASLEISLTAADYLELVVYQNSGGALNASDTEALCAMTVSYRGAP